MARPRPSATDPRQRYTHQAYNVSYGGISPERGPSGRNTLLAMTYRSAMMFTAPADTAGEQIVGDVPYGVWIDGFILHEAIAAGTFKLTLKGVGGGADVDLIEALTGVLTAAGPTVLDNPVYLPLTNSQPLAMTIVGGTAGATVRASLLVTSAEAGWK